MAADRLLGSLASLSDAFHPAVLRMVQETCRGGDQQRRPVGVCGEAAADPLLAVVLVGLGATSLSMSASAIGDVRAELASHTLEDARRLAQAAVAMSSADEARNAVQQAMA